MSSLRSLALFALSAVLATVSAADVSGDGTTTRYWDCCKGSCSWTGKASVSNPVTTCDIDDSPLTDYTAASGCDGGDAYVSFQGEHALSSHRYVCLEVEAARDYALGANSQSRSTV